MRDDLGGDGLPMPDRRWAILVMATGLSLAALNGAITNIALPTIAKDLQADAAATVWVVNAFQLALTVSLLPLSSLGDILGYRQIYIAGLALFTAASLACALAPSLDLLIAARVLQGMGAAAITAVNTALVRFIYPQALLGRGLGMNVMVVATMSAAGPSIAAAILALASWPWLFLLNLPLGLALLPLAWRWLPRNAGSGQRFDVPGAALTGLTFGGLILGISGLGHGQPAAVVAAALAAALACGVLLVRRETRSRHPMLALVLFARPVFSLSILTSICSYSAQGLAYVALPFYLEDVLGHSQIVTGMLMTPWPLAVAVMSPLAGWLADRYAAGVIGTVGLVALAAGLACLAALPAAPDALDIAWRMALCGIGFGLFQSPNNRTVVQSAPRERSGAAGGLMSMARLVGQTTGAALVAMIFGVIGAVGGSVIGTRAAVLTGAGFAATGALVSAMRLVGPRRV